MGACDFHTTVAKTTEIQTASAAFDQAVSQAQWEHGHGGYSGTIAEKHSFVEVSLPAGFTAMEFANAISDTLYTEFTPEPTEGEPKYVTDARELHRRLRSALHSPQIERLGQTYSDKWGPALCITSPDGWHFTGLASE